MPGVHLTQKKRDRFTSLRVRGLGQYEAMQLVEISRQSAARIERTDEFKAAMASKSDLHHAEPAKPFEPPPREIPLEIVADRLLSSLREVPNPETAEAVVASFRSVLPPEILANITSQLPTGVLPTSSRTGDLPAAAPSDDDDPDGSRYGPRDDSTPPQAVDHNGMLRRTWSPDDRHLNPVSRAQAIRVARNRPPASGSLERLRELLTDKWSA